MKVWSRWLEAEEEEDWLLETNYSGGFHPAVNSHSEQGILSQA